MVIVISSRTLYCDVIFQQSANNRSSEDFVEFFFFGSESALTCMDEKKQNRQHY